MTEPRTGFPTLRFQLLGPVRAWRNGVEVDLGAAKQRAVLAVLLIDAGRPVTTARIIDAVWQDQPPKNGPNVVQKYVAGLRRVLDPFRSPRSPGQVLGSSDAGYVLHTEDGGVDADEFARLVREADGMRRRGQLAGASAALHDALGLWHGEPLTGLTGPLFDATRDHLAAERVDAFERWADVEIALGRQAGVIADLVRAVADHPLRERLRYLLVLALYRAGRQAEALAAYHDASRYLDEELGVEPGERLRALHLAILRGEPAPDEHEPSPLPVPAAPVPRPAPDQPVPPDPPPGHAGVPAPVAYAAPPVLVPQPPYLPMPDSDRRWRPGLTRVLAALIPFVSFGVASWAMLAYFAARRHSLAHTLCAVGYFALIALVFVAIGQDDGSDPNAPLTALDVTGLMALLVAWLGGTVHTALLAGGRGPGAAR